MAETKAKKAEAEVLDLSNKEATKAAIAKRKEKIDFFIVEEQKRAKALKNANK